MKTNQIIGVVAMVSLSFAACEKQQIVPSESAARGASFATAPGTATSIEATDGTVSALLPHIVLNVANGTKTVYLYNGSQLATIMDGTITNKFEYDEMGRLDRVTISNIRTPDEVRVLHYEYDQTKSRLPVLVTDRSEDMKEGTALIRKVLFKFNGAGLKISESEFNDALAYEVKHTFFEYDSKNNCKSIVVMHDMKKVSEIRFEEFDSRPNALIQLPILQLLPGEFAKRSNATSIIVNGTDDKPWVEKHSFEYQAGGWPIREMVEVGGAKKLLKTFSYLSEI